MGEIEWKPIRAAAFEIVNERGTILVRELMNILKDRFSLPPSAMEVNRLPWEIRGRKNEVRVDGKIKTIIFVTNNPETGESVSGQMQGWARIFDATNTAPPEVASAPLSSVPIAPTEPAPGVIASQQGKKVYAEYEGLEGRIPPIEAFKSYIPRQMLGKTDVEILETAIENNKHVLIIGPPGNGKTAVTRAVCAKLRRPYIRNEGHGGAEVSDLIGQWAPATGGKFEWVDGLLTRAVRVGGVYIQDEINALAPELTFKIHSLLDQDKKITLTENGGEEVTAYQKFAFIGTMNEGTQGVREMNEAFRDRFDVTLFFDYDTDIEAKKVNKTTAGKSLREAATKLRASYGTELHMYTSMRGLLQFEENIRLFGIAAAKEFFVGKFPPEDRPVVRQVLDSVVEDS